MPNRSLDIDLQVGVQFIWFQAPFLPHPIAESKAF